MNIQEKLAEARQGYLLSAANETALRRRLETAKSETDALADKVRTLEELAKEALANSGD